MKPRGRPGAALLTILLIIVLVSSAVPSGSAHSLRPAAIHRASAGTNPAVSNFSAAIGRLVTLAAAAGAGLLSLVWARVALSWFSHDSLKKVLAKERARDALIGTLLFIGAVSGLVWALANWVVTGA
ncbi:MAG: hypothetical protein L3K14_02025 [Thermoplasmata archaeon]|nr:hypothetical protein [Thermoplasmata archaeon]